MIVQLSDAPQFRVRFILNLRQILENGARKERAGHQDLQNI